MYRVRSLDNITNQPIIETFRLQVGRASLIRPGAGHDEGPAPAGLDGRDHILILWQASPRPREMRKAQGSHTRPLRIDPRATETNTFVCTFERFIVYLD
jgi:hypothetical protein